MQHMLNTTNNVLLQTLLLLLNKNLQDTGTTNEILESEVPKNSKLQHIFSSYYNYISWGNQQTIHNLSKLESIKINFAGRMVEQITTFMR